MSDSYHNNDEKYKRTIKSPYKKFRGSPTKSKYALQKYDFVAFTQGQNLNDIEAIKKQFKAFNFFREDTITVTRKDTLVKSSSRAKNFLNSDEKFARLSNKKSSVKKK